MSTCSADGRWGRCWRADYCLPGAKQPLGCAAITTRALYGRVSKGSHMIFGRVKPLDAILATAEKKSLHRSLGAFQLTMLGIGAVIGTGIFVLTATAAQKAGPGMMLSFVVAGVVCALAA